jgi:ABC-type polysaccharide/polyol phosphate export permease
MTSVQRFFQVLRQYFPLLLALAWDDIKLRYVRSILGPFWLVLATAVTALGMSYIWSILFHQDKTTFVPALCVGLVIFQFLSACVTEAPDCFVRYGSIIKNATYPPVLFPAVVVIKNFIMFLHSLVIVVVVLLIYPPQLNVSAALIIPNVVLVLLLLICLTTVLAFVGARFRDISPAITSLMTIVFFLSPVIYKPDQLGVKAHLMWLNPFSYLITLIRAPITGYSVPGFVYLVSILMLLIGFYLCYLLISRRRNQLVFWL